MTWLTIKEASDRYGIPSGTLYMYCSLNKLKHRRTGWGGRAAKIQLEENFLKAYLGWQATPELSPEPIADPPERETEESAAPAPSGDKPSAHVEGKRPVGRPKKVRDETPVFINASGIAHHFDITARQLTNWVAQGYFPPPWARPGACTRVWRRDHWDTFVATGKWPREAWKGR